MLAKKVIHVDFPGAYTGSGGKLSAPSTKPGALGAEDAALAHAGRERIPPPLAGQNFLPDLMHEDARAKGEKFMEREAPKPLHVVQPEGVSFKMDGNVLEWQKWKLHIGTPVLCVERCAR
jgi:primary-amine oxidase